MPEAETTPEILSVAAVNARFERELKEAFPVVWVEGEVAMRGRPGPGQHAYFELKDERQTAVLSCVMFRGAFARGGELLEPGARVLVRGVPSIYSQRGHLQLRVELVRARGRGALLEALEKLKQRLLAEGLFEREKKRALPLEPRVIGIVTSAQGAVIHDIRKVAFQRGNAHLVLSASLVQGAEAPRSIIAALDLIERHPELDVLIVGRGGGSQDDLMAFNDEAVVRRLARCRVPVVSAVGHETDVTLADLVADVRAATPSQAAEYVIPDNRARAERLRRLSGALSHALRSRRDSAEYSLGRLRSRLGDPRYLLFPRAQHLDELSARLRAAERASLPARRLQLERLERRLRAQHPSAVLAEQRGRLHRLDARLAEALRRRLVEARAEVLVPDHGLAPAARAELSRARGLLGELAARLHALSPLAVLGRGYAIARTERGVVVRTPSELRPGERFTLIVEGGSLEARRVTPNPEQPALPF